MYALITECATKFIAFIIIYLLRNKTAPEQKGTHTIH